VKGDRRRLPADWTPPKLDSLLENDFEEDDEDEFADFEHYEVKGDRRRLPADWTPLKLDSLLENDFDDEEYPEYLDEYDSLLENGEFEDEHEDFEHYEVKGDRRRLPADWMERADPDALAALHSLLQGDEEEFARYIDSVQDEGDFDDHGSLLENDFDEEDFEHYEVKGDRRRLPADWTPPKLDSLLENDFEEDDEDEFADFEHYEVKGDRRRLPADWTPLKLDSLLENDFDDEEYPEYLDEYDSLLENGEFEDEHEDFEHYEVKGDRRRLPADWMDKLDPEAKAALDSLLEGDGEEFEKFFQQNEDTVEEQ